MKIFDVYPLFDIVPEKARGSYLYDKTGKRYLDMYGGHAVISIGHSHPQFVQAISEQLEKMAFYSNSVVMPAQQKLAEAFGRISGCADYQLFLCNSGAEANENAFKLASFHTGKKKIIAFKGSFHGRTSAAVAATDDRKISAPININPDFVFCDWNNAAMLEELLSAGDTAAVIIEGIQGVGGVQVPSAEFLRNAAALCRQHGALLILDEIQSGCGRTGKYFAHQHAGITPDLITAAKGIGNGFPVAAVFISPAIEARHGMLGTTFGGSYLACAAAHSVIEVMEREHLMENAKSLGSWLKTQLSVLPGVKEVRGEGLMLGAELDVPLGPVRKDLLGEHHVFTGASPQCNTIRILPALNADEEQCSYFVKALKAVLEKQGVTPNDPALA